jgi:YVTN family beta-propeller protein
VLNPAGFQVEFPGRPTDIALSPDGALLAVMNKDSLVLIRVRDRAIMQTLPLPKGGHTFVGIIWAPDGSAIYSSGTKGVINRFKIDGGIATLGQAISLPGPGGGVNPVPGGLALSADGGTIYVCLSRNNSLGVVDAASGQLKAEIPVGVAPYGAALNGQKAYPWLIWPRGRRSLQSRSGCIRAAFCSAATPAGCSWRTRTATPCPLLTLPRTAQWKRFPRRLR